MKLRTLKEEEKIMSNACTPHVLRGSYQSLATVFVHKKIAEAVSMTVVGVKKIAEAVGMTFVGVKTMTGGGGDDRMAAGRASTTTVAGVAAALELDFVVCKGAPGIMMGGTARRHYTRHPCVEEKHS